MSRGLRRRRLQCAGIGKAPLPRILGDRLQPVDVGGEQLGGVVLVAQVVNRLCHRIAQMRAARVQNCEMESGILLTLAGLFGLQAGSICVVSDRAPWPGPAELDIDKNMDAGIGVATDAMLAWAKGA